MTAVLLTLSIWFLPYHCDSVNCLVKTTQKKTVLVKDIPIFVSVAETLVEKKRGLSDKGELKENEGMLFIFDEPDKHGFWMKDMKFSIDIVWIQDNQIVFIEKNVSPDTYPTMFYPSKPANLVLELPGGFCDAHSISVGDFLSEPQ